MDEFIGIIKLFAGNFAPRGWALCNGSLLAISQNSALFAILGTTYGGNGTTTFALPDLRSRIAVGMGQGPGLSPYVEGQMGGAENVTLLAPQMPMHTHLLVGNGADANAASPAGAMLALPNGTTASGDAVTINTYTTTTPGTPAPMAPASISAAGGSQPHENRPPYLALNYIICLEGIFPSRA